MEASIEARKERLRELAHLLGQGPELRAERDALCRALKDEGIPRAELAELASTTVENIKYILGDRTSRRRQSAAT